MPRIYPQAQALEICSPKHLIAARYQAGYEHAIKGLQLCRREHLRLSFREGYRAGKLYLRELRRQHGVLNFPMQGRICFRV